MPEPVHNVLFEVGEGFVNQFHYLHRGCAETDANEQRVSSLSVQIRQWVCAELHAIGRSPLLIVAKP